jgi:hypothetical protein
MKTPLSPPDKSKEKRIAKLTLGEDGTIEGDVTIEYSGHLGVERKLLNDDDSPVQREENLKEAMKGRLSSAELTNIVIENVTDSTKPFICKYHVRVPGYGQRTGKRLFFQPAFFHKGVDALFSAGTRKYPIYFHFPWSEEDEVSITLPRGYVLDNADRPAPINAGAASQYEVSMGITNDKTTLIYKRKFFFGGNGNSPQQGIDDSTKKHKSCRDSSCSTNFHFQPHSTRSAGGVWANPVDLSGARGSLRQRSAFAGTLQQDDGIIEDAFREQLCGCSRPAADQDFDGTRQRAASRDVEYRTRSRV